MSEDFLHYLWRYKNYNTSNLRTVQNNTVEILFVGEPNYESGPDFFNAKVRIDDIVWVGHVEVHVNSSDWYKHGHQNDEAYSKVILHVVFNYDKDVFDIVDNIIPTIELNGRVSRQLQSKYHQLSLSKFPLVCQGMTSGLNGFLTSQWLGRVLVERLESKIMDLNRIHTLTKGSWEQTVFIQLAKNMGFKVNSVPMQLLAEQLDFNILKKKASSIFVLESILFGVAGFLEEKVNSEYHRKLRIEFGFQKKAHGFNVLPLSIWKFGGVRPINFPTLRIAQLAKLIQDQGSIFQFLIYDFETKRVTEKLMIKASPFWDNHFTFHKNSEHRVKIIGLNSINNILINTVSSLLFFYGKELDEPKFREQSIDLLEELPAEINSIVKCWGQNSIKPNSAADSQALIQLTKFYCKDKKCLNCGIGKQILG